MADFSQVSINPNKNQGHISGRSFLTGLTQLAWTTDDEDEQIIAGTVVRVASGIGALIVGRCDATDTAKLYPLGMAGTIVPFASSGVGVQEGVTGTIVQIGSIALLEGDWRLVTEDGNPLVDGAQYFLSTSEPGKITNVRPVGGLDWVVPVGQAKSGGPSGAANYQRMFLQIGTPVQNPGE